MRELILKLNREHGITVLISSHILDELARLATHYGFIDSGHMIREMSAEELEEKLELDTNTLLSISSGDRAVRMLAAASMLSFVGCERNICACKMEMLS